MAVQQGDILFEDNHLIAVYKKTGDIVQGDKTGDIPLSEHVKDFLKEKYGKPGNVFCGVIHRIDRPVTGIVLFAKTSKALERMNAQFQKKDVRKTYLAVVRNAPPADEGHIKAWLRKNEKQNKSFASEKEVPGSLFSELKYKVLARSERFFLLETDPLTGRHHQIRCLLAWIGCPITGDVKYGDRRANADKSICLHASELRFTHPVSNEPVHIKAALPQLNFWHVF
ncbi:MAG: RluA family pseudouridine synthase [Bacteroidia bacterium]|nr:RluA family pseudouridine synthase [Bacteroidia bacterium]